MSIDRGRHGGSLWRARLACDGDTNGIALPADILRRAIPAFVSVPLRRFPQGDHGHAGGHAHNDLPWLVGFVRAAWWDAAEQAVMGIVELFDQDAERRAFAYYEAFRCAPLSGSFLIGGTLAAGSGGEFVASIKHVHALDLVDRPATAARILRPLWVGENWKDDPMVLDLAEAKAPAETDLMNEIEKLLETEQALESEFAALQDSMGEIESAAGEALLAEVLDGQDGSAASERVVTAAARIRTLDAAICAARSKRAASIGAYWRSKARASEAAAAMLEEQARTLDDQTRAKLAELDDLSGLGWLARYDTLVAGWTTQGPHLAIIDYRSPDAAPAVLRLRAEARELRRTAERQKTSDVTRPDYDSQVRGEGTDLEAIIRQMSTDPLKLAPRPSEIRAWAAERLAQMQLPHGAPLRYVVLGRAGALVREKCAIAPVAAGTVPIG